LKKITKKENKQQNKVVSAAIKIILEKNSKLPENLWMCFKFENSYLEIYSVPFLQDSTDLKIFTFDLTRNLQEQMKSFEVCSEIYFQECFKENSLEIICKRLYSQKIQEIDESVKNFFEYFSEHCEDEEDLSLEEKKKVSHNPSTGIYESVN